MTRNYAALVIAFTLGFALIAAVIAFLLPKRYTALLQMLVDQRPLPSQRASGVSNDLLSDAIDFGRPRSISTQAELLGSLGVINRALTAVGERTGIPVGLGSQLDPVAIQNRMNIVASTESDVITLEVQMSTPELAVDVANELYLAYGQVVNANSRDAAARAVTRIQARLNSSQSELANTRKELQKLKEDMKLPLIEQQGQAKVQLGSAQAQDVASARANLAGQTARLAVLRQQRDLLRKSIDAGTTRAISQSYRSIVDTLTGARTERSKLLERYLPEAEPVKEIDRQIASLQAELNKTEKFEMVSEQNVANQNIQEISLEIARTAADVDSLNQRIISLTASERIQDEALAKLPKQQRELSEKNLEAAIQERNVQELSTVLNAALGLRDSGAIVTSLVLPAVSAPTPTFPNIPLLILAGATIGGVLGSIVAFNIESRRRPLRSLAQLQALVRNESIGLLPGGIDALPLQAHTTEAAYSSAILSLEEGVTRIAIVSAPNQAINGANAIGLINALRRRHWGVNVTFARDAGRIQQDYTRAAEVTEKALTDGSPGASRSLPEIARSVEVRFYGQVSTLLDDTLTGEFVSDQVCLAVRFGMTRSGELVQTTSQLHQLAKKVIIIALGSRDFHLDVEQYSSNS